jgi:hypothetical protein
MPLIKRRQAASLTATPVMGDSSSAGHMSDLK